MELKKIKDSLNSNRGEILESLKHSPHFSEYIFLRERFAARKVDEEFKKRFSAFYVLNGPRGMNDAQKDTFFSLLSSREDKIDSILSALYKVPGYGKKNKLFLSFSTKLLHTLNDSLPIYDKNIAHVLNSAKPKYSKGLDDRIADRVKIYEDLKSDSAALMEDSWVQAYMKQMREDLDLSSRSVSDAKLIDSLIWKLFAFI